MVTHMDKGVGRLVNRLADLGLLENTILFFAGDNGYSQWGYFGRERFIDDPVFKNKGPWPKGKFTCTHEGGVRVPFFVYWKGTIEPGVSDHTCALYDFLATAADLAGVQSPRTDGISLAPTLLGDSEQQESHKYLYWENGTFSEHAQSALVDQWWAYRTHPGSPIKVYNVEEDISCERNVAEGHPDIVEKIKRIFEEAHEDSQWYVNPGETKPQVDEKRSRARESNSIQISTKANSTYGKDGQAR